MNAAADSPFAPPQPRATVLVVEDNVLSRAVLADTLRGEGYRVLEAAFDIEAKAILASIPIDLLFVDLHLPSDGEGIDVAQEAAGRQPGIRIILTSGRLRSEDEPIVEQLGTFVPKPYLLSRVLELIRSSFAPDEA